MKQDSPDVAAGKVGRVGSGLVGFVVGAGSGPGRGVETVVAGGRYAGRRCCCKDISQVSQCRDDQHIGTGRVTDKQLW